MILLSILIPTIVGREEQYNNLYKILVKQYEGGEVEICTLKDNKEMSIGEKRNKLLQIANGKYVAFIDDDDIVSENYISLLLEAAKSDCDCASLLGAYSVDGVFDGLFEHSLKYNEWRTTVNDIKYERYPNHLSMIKSNIAKQFKFPEINHGEDADWSTQIHKSRILQTEYHIPEIIYYYNKTTVK